jgi:hypothetical protein
MALPDHFEGEDVIITFEKEDSGTITNMEGKILNWNISGGSQPTEDVYTFGGKTFNFSKPREKFELEFEVVINNSDFDFVQFGSGTTGAAIGNMTGKVVSSADSTGRWRIIMWFQESQYHVKDGTVVVPSKANSIYRMIFCDVKSVTFDKEFSAEEYMKGTLTLEFSATDESGYANYFQEEGIGVGTSTTATLASMTTTAGKGLFRKAKGYLDWNATTAAWTAGTASTRYRYTG